VPSSKWISDYVQEQLEQKSALHLSPSCRPNNLCFLKPFIGSTLASMAGFLASFLCGWYFALIPQISPNVHFKHL